MKRFEDCAVCRNWVSISEGVCLRCGTGLGGATPATGAPDLVPASVLGTVPHGPLWTAFDVARGEHMTAFRIVGPGIAIDLAPDQAAGLAAALQGALAAQRG